MYIIPKLRLVWRNETDRGLIDGIYNKGNSFFITFVHGSKMGHISIQGRSAIYRSSIINLRKDILKESSIFIPVKYKLYIAPCHPYYVKLAQGKDGRAENIHIFGNWKSPTHSNIVDDNGFMLYPRDIKNIERHKNVFNMVVWHTRQHAYSHQVQFAIQGYPQRGIEII